MNSKLTIWLLSLLVFSSLASANETMTPSEVKYIFLEYESLNNAFLSSVGSVRELVYRKRVEEYAEGEFEKALNASVVIVCKTGNMEVISALFRVTYATSNSASESPSWALGSAYFCKPEIVSKVFLSLPEIKKLSLYKSLSFGFENVVYNKKDKNIGELREKLQSLEVNAK